MRTYHSIWVAIWVTILSTLLVSNTAVHAAVNLPLAVSPVVVKMNAVTAFSSVSVGNRGNQATGIEVEVLRVKWVDGQEQYEASTDFIVSPPTFRLLANKDRLVRFRYSGQRSDTEGFYRLFIRQLPEETVANQINLVVNLGVPIFVAPLTSKPALAVTISAAESKTYALRNTGNVTLNILTLEGENCLLAQQKVLPRLSPGQQTLISADLAQCATAAKTDQGLILLTP